MKPKELREKTLQELEQKLHSLKEGLFNLRYQGKTGRLEKPSLIRSIKRDIARINTIAKEKEDEQKPQQKKD
ncbi:MAG: 50S ribosomal protein L29 [Candidatus Omnitrophica bacterium]|nr:50S ribosomal protein L29 [Candidatus Omnitrophota bacterium]MBU4140627.1 50S ribosomal protein L29 [Candidatus Omnitrophota bacterium]